MSTMIQADKTPKPPDGREFSVTIDAVAYAAAVGECAIASRVVVRTLGLDNTGSQLWLLVPPRGRAIIVAGFFLSVIRSYRKALQLWKDELSARERELEGIAATVANGIIIVDLEDQILRVNQAFCELFGYKEEEILGKPTDFLTVDGQPAESQPRAVLEAAKKVGLWQGHVLRCTQDGTALPVQLSIAPIRDEHGAVVAYVGDYQDFRAATEAREHIEGLGAVVESLSQEMDVEKLGRKAVNAAMLLTGAEMGGVALKRSEERRVG